MNVNLPTEEQIRNRAYEIFVQHGCQPGHEVDDWLQAEYELTQLPVDKIVELEPPTNRKHKPGRKTLVGVVRAALVPAGSDGYRSATGEP